MMDQQRETMEFGAVTSVGQVRDHNEDSWIADEAHGLWVIADGMGGHEAGEVASRIACEAIRRAVSEGESLSGSIKIAQSELDAAIQRGEGSEGMGTTVVALKADSGRYQIAWVGDSRAYLWHDGQLRQLTHDHSFVQELIDNQAINAAEAEQHPERSTLSRCLGGGLEDELEVDEISARFFAGERVILCSDGVSGEINEAEFLACLREHNEDSPEKIAEALVQRALDAGGNDNATALVIAAPSSAPDRIRQTAPRRRLEIPLEKTQERGLAKMKGIFFAAILIIAVAIVGWQLMQRVGVESRPESPPQGHANMDNDSTLVYQIQPPYHSNLGD